jgi:hypothetical protein
MFVPSLLQLLAKVGQQFVDKWVENVMNLLALIQRIVHDDGCGLSSSDVFIYYALCN